MKVLKIVLISLLPITSCAASSEIKESKNHSNADREYLMTWQDRPAAYDLIEARSLYIKGIAQFEMQNYERAREYLVSANALNQRSSGIHYALMDVYLKMDDLTNAVYFGSRAVEMNPENKWYRLKLSEAYRRLGKIEEAINELWAVLEYNPNDIDILFLIASVQSNQGRYEESNKTYDKILELTGSDRSIHYQKFQNFTNLGEPDSAIVELENIRKLSPGNVNTLHMLSQFYMENNQPDEAKEVLEDALQRNPRDPETLVNLSDIYINEGDWQTGGEILISVVEDSLISPVNKAELVQYMLSRFPYEQGNEEYFEAVETMIETMVAKNSNFGLSHALAAEFYSMIEDYNKALKYLEETTRLMPENDAAWRQRLQLLHLQNRYEESVEIGLEADKRIPDDALIQFYIGGAYFLMEDKENAIIWLKSASQLPSRAILRSIILGTLGDSHASVDNWEEADKAYESAIRYDSENDVALNNYAYYLAERNIKIEEAEAMARKALSLKPDNPAYLDTMGWIYFKMGEYEKAKEYIEASINTGSASAEVMEHMGYVYEKLGDLEKAFYWWHKAYSEDNSRIHLQEKLSGS